MFELNIINAIDNLQHNIQEYVEWKLQDNSDEDVSAILHSRVVNIHLNNIASMLRLLKGDVDTPVDEFKHPI